MSDVLAGLDAIEWHRLDDAYGDAARTPDVLRRLAASSSTVVDDAWQQLYEGGLYHQGTVYPATAAAMPFLAGIAAMPGARRRPRLMSYLAWCAVGKDEPYAPKGTASKVREAIRGALHQLTPYLVDASDRAVGLAMSELAAVYPFELAPAKPMVSRLFAEEKIEATRAALAGTLAMLGEATPEVMTHLLQAERDSVYRGVRHGEHVIIPPELRAGKDVPGAEDVVGLPVHAQILAWRRESPPGVEDENFLTAARTVQAMFEDDAVYWAK